MPRGRSRRWAWSLVGAALVGLCGSFVVATVARHWGVARDALGDADRLWLAAGLVAAGAAMVAIAFPWASVLAALGGPVERRLALPLFFVGEIAKYVPGGVWPVLGRVELAHRAGVGRGRAFGSVVLSLAALYLAGLIVAAVLVVFAVDGEGLDRTLWPLALLPLGLASLHPRVLRMVATVASRAVRRPAEVTAPSWPQAVGLVARYLPAWVLVTGATWCVARAFDADAAWAPVALATVLSWVVGFMALPAPGGVGVREAVFVAAAPLPAGVAAVVAVVARLCFVSADAVGAAVSSAVVRRRWRGDARASPMPAVDPT